MIMGLHQPSIKDTLSWKSVLICGEGCAASLKAYIIQTQEDQQARYVDML
jgi:hypothetical protein